MRTLLSGRPLRGVVLMAEMVEPWLVNVRDVLRRPGAYKHIQVERALPGLSSGLVQIAATTPVHLDASVENVVDGLLVRGEVTVVTQMACARCLVDVDGELRVPVEELFTFSAADAEEEGYALQDKEMLPLEAMVRDAVVLELPTVPLCRTDCAGLCPTCGENRNDVACDHGSDVIDPRWAALAQLAAVPVRDPDSSRS